MKKSTLVILMLAVCCLSLTKTAQAQNTLSYATVDYDAETNTIYGYAYTEPDYSAGVYYRTAHVSAKLRDGSGNELAYATKQITGSRAEVYLQASGNGNPPYKIQSGHVLIQSYYVYNYWDSWNYRYSNGWLDYYNYTYYLEGGGGPVIDIPLFFQFGGRRPETVRGSPNITLGQLLTTVLAPSNDTVKFKTVSIGSLSRDFDDFNNAELPLNEASGGSNFCHGSASNEFTLTFDFYLPPDASSVFMDARSFVSETAQSQFSRSGPLQFSNINLSAPKSGRVSVKVFRKRPASDFSDNKVRLTVSGGRSGSGAYGNPGRVKLTCP